jgi:hypothetical protein
VEGVERVEKQYGTREEARNVSLAYASGQSLCAALPIMILGAAMDRHGKIGIINADRFEEGVIITFSDGQSVLYHPQFLYDMREHNDNRPVVEDESLDEELS